MRGLEQLYRDYGSRGLVILGFPCNQFMGQEPGSAEEIAEFCSLTYDVTFPIFAKLEVNGSGESPLYTWLKAGHPAISSGILPNSSSAPGMARWPSASPPLSCQPI
jgi:glutathione peroxidase